MISPPHHFRLWLLHVYLFKARRCLREDKVTLSNCQGSTLCWEEPRKPQQTPEPWKPPCEALPFISMKQNTSYKTLSNKYNNTKSQEHWPMGVRTKKVFPKTIKSSDSPNLSVHCSCQILSRSDSLMCFWNRAKISSHRVSPGFINSKVSRESIMLSKHWYWQHETWVIMYTEDSGGEKNNNKTNTATWFPNPIPANFWKQVVIASEWWVSAHMKSLLSFAWHVRAFNTC